ncbi:hypothetical protein BJV77DRAFT_613318 [Russula vinacea]|nr:hypothetical protein BJV77DRAFT_613318 [Russula vinacea]
MSFSKLSSVGPCPVCWGTLVMSPSQTGDFHFDNKTPCAIPTQASDDKPPPEHAQCAFFFHIGHVWTLSRDRALRLWTAHAGCTSAKLLPSVASPNREPSSSSPPVPALRQASPSASPVSS